MGSEDATREIRKRDVKAAAATTVATTAATTAATTTATAAAGEPSTSGSWQRNLFPEDQGLRSMGIGVDGGGHGQVKDAKGRDQALDHGEFRTALDAQQ